MQFVTNMAEVQIFEVMCLQFCTAQSIDVTNKKSTISFTTVTTTTIATTTTTATTTKNIQIMLEAVTVPR